MMSRVRDERAAAAILVAVMATVLFGVAALAVDLGNAWARKREIQKQVDISGISAGWALPATTPAAKAAVADEVARYLVKNDVWGQDTITGTSLLDGSDSNGEIYFSDGDTTMRVVAPPAHVDFMFGTVIGAGDGTPVTADATVQVRSPLPPTGRVLPFAMPDRCPFGPGMADTASPGHTPADTSGTFDPGNPKEGSVNSLSTNPDPVVGASTDPVTVTVTITGFSNNTAVSSVELLFQNGGATYYVPVTSWTPVGNTTNTDKERTMTVTVPQEVVDTPGTWNVWGRIANKHTNDSKSFVVGTPASVPPTEIGCVSSASGEFGQMYSPRGNQPPDQRGLALNIALGLDHDLAPWPSAPQPSCGRKNETPPTGGVQDKPNPPKDPNCVLPQTGNDGKWMLDGLIRGIEGEPGRLSVSRGHTLPGCGAGDVEREGVMINNDRLSCFLKDGYTLNDLTTTSGDLSGILDPAVVNSPRFLWLPVIHPITRAEIDNNTFYAIKRFVPAFITNDPRSATNEYGDSAPANDPSDPNGVVINGQLESLQVFMFNPAALPPDSQAPTIEYDPLAGKVLRLID